MVAFAPFFGPEASSSTKPNLHSHRRPSPNSLSTSLLESSLSPPLSLSSRSDRMSYSEDLGQGTVKSARSEGKKLMIRTVARDLIF